MENAFTSIEGLQGVLCVMDNILIFGTTRQEHNSRLQAVLNVFPQLALHLTVESVQDQSYIPWTRP